MAAPAEHVPQPRVRVLRIISRLNVGGPALHALLLNDRLDQRRYDSRLVAGRVGEAEGDYLALHGAVPERFVAVPALGREVRGWRDWSAFWSLVRLIRTFRPHVVHTHTAKAGTLGRIAAALCRVPVVVHTYHGHVFEGYFSPFKTRVVVAIERLLAYQASALVAVTDRVRRDVLARGIGWPERVVVVPLGLDLDPLLAAPARRGELRAELGLAPAVPLVGIVARLVPVKAHETFLQAARAIAPVRPDVVFLVVGDGERRAGLEEAARTAGLAARIRFLGWRADLDRLYADLDVVVLTSKNEGSPVALIEAMAAGRPVVSTRAGGVEDVVIDGETGVVVPVGDAAAVARAVVDLLEDPARAERLGTAARASVIAQFASSRLVGDIDALYQRLLAGRGARV
ncbi:MAG TPA: glycosyltransferase [Vicinamibacterales bacterium]|nr:glycosyltransferase [Vicinamibacterales bacterium]